MPNYWFDMAAWQDDVKILTEETLMIPGMEMFGNNCASGKLRILHPHIHKTAEFLYLENGTQKYYINDKEYTLKSGQMLIVDADVIHSTGKNPYGRHESLWFRLDVKEFAESIGVEPQLKKLIVSSLCGRSDPVVSLEKNMYAVLKSAFFDLASENNIDRLRGYSKFVSFITELIRSAEPKNSYSEDIQQVLDYIAENINANMPLEELADTVGLSLSGFKQKFRREVGITPREYVNLLKIEKAKEYLSKGMSVTETAFALDFSSSSYFSVLFRQIENMPPSMYIKKHLREKA